MPEREALDAALADALPSVSVRSATPVDAGWSNAVWRVDTTEGTFVVRLPRPGTAPDPAKRRREAEVWRRAAAAEIAPEPTHLDPERGVLITPAVAGADLDDHLGGAAPSPTLLDALGELLARFHGLATTGLDTVDVLGALDADLARSARAGLRHPPAIASARARAPALERNALAHHDLIPANVLVGARLWLVDLEASGPGDGTLDLVSLSETLGLDAQGERRLFRAAGRPLPDPARRRALGDLFQLREYAWAALRIVEGREDPGVRRQLRSSAEQLRRPA